MSGRDAALAYMRHERNVCQAVLRWLSEEAGASTDRPLRTHLLAYLTREELAWTRRIAEYLMAPREDFIMLFQRSDPTAITKALSKPDSPMFSGGAQ